MLKKVFKISLSVLIAVCILSSLLVSLPAVADGAKAVISLSKSSPSVGDDITVTVTVSGTELTGAQMEITYDSEVLTYKSGATEGGAGFAKIVDSEFTTAGIKSRSYKLVFSAKKSGSSAVAVSGVLSDGVPASDAAIGASAKITVKDAAKSSNANLKTLSLSAGSLSPKFSPSVTKYTAEVGKSVTTCKVYAEAADSSAKVSVSGSSELKIGKNTRTVTVTAANGDQKNYTVEITRSDVDEVSSTASDSALTSVIDGVTYDVCADIVNVKLPNGFSISKAMYNEQEVQVASNTEGNFVLYYLKNSSETEPLPYTYDEEMNLFTKVKLYEQGDNTYILLDIPAETLSNSNYYKTAVDIDDNNVKCYAITDTQKTDFVYVYVYFDGKFGYYRYDKQEKTLQRDPFFNPSEKEVIAEVKPENEGGFFSRFTNLSANARTIIICLAVIVLGIIILALIVLIRIIRLHNLPDIDFDIANKEAFESVNVNDHSDDLLLDDNEFPDLK